MDKLANERIFKEGEIMPIYKPVGVTSHDIINRLRQITNIRKIGHAGTLDPLAEGVLVVAFGRIATKQLKDITNNTDKEYTAVIDLSAFSVTDDSEGPLRRMNVSQKPSLDKIKSAIDEIAKRVYQTPPPYSAIKIGGKKAYTLARQGIMPKLPPRPVKLRQAKIINYRWPLLKIKLVTDPGYYIRSFARDLGKLINTGGYLRNLTRNRIGPYTLEAAYNVFNTPLDQVQKYNTM